MLQNIIHEVFSGDKDQAQDRKIKCVAVLMAKRNVLGFHDSHEFSGHVVSLQLISTTNIDENYKKGIVGEPAYLEFKNKISASESEFNCTFNWDEIIGVPGAFLVKNNHNNDEFYLKTVTLEDIPGPGRIHFVCNSWIYTARYYKTDRIFFTNKPYLPDETPKGVRVYREEELVNLRGDGRGELHEWDRIYDYAFYNDLGDPDKGSSYVRPVLGGSAEHPYPRRGRTGRKPTESDPNSESRLSLLKSLSIYVPSDERFSSLKLSDFLAFGFASIAQLGKHALQGLFDSTPEEFDSFRDELNIYEGTIQFPESHLQDSLLKKFLSDFLTKFGLRDVKEIVEFPLPDVIKEDASAWRTDDEFSREMLAGLNPIVIHRLEEFPPKSKLESKVYGNHDSSITADQIKNNLDGLSIDEAIQNNRLFILDHHDTLMPYLRRINTTSTKTYASRTLLFLKDDGTLRPLAIELSLPHTEGDQFGAISKVYTPAEGGVEGSIWQLAKAYVAVNDSGFHQLMSHWTLTHAVIEPFVIATHRQMSVIHPIYKLLHPHFRDTMNINAIARQVLLNAGGLLEYTVFPSKYALEWSSEFYKSWVFNEQAVPEDLKKRGMAVDDPNAPHGLRLLIKDYPYAVDGLEIWSAINDWVKSYCSFYYKTDEAVKNDTELQSWWKEIREEGHGDKKDETWWPKMQTVDELIQSCTIIIWVASALHASVNFGQYSYAGYHPNRPTKSRRFMPEEGSPEYEELESNPDRAFLKTISSQLQTLAGISLIELLSKHSSDEVYLGQRDTPEWTADAKPAEAFEEFGKKLAGIEEKIIEMNKDEKLKNRVGPVKLPYTLMFPTSESGLTGKGIPNSVSM